MKKLFVVSILLASSLFCLFAKPVKYKDFLYEIGDEEITILKYDGSAESVSITKSLNKKQITKIAPGAFAGNTNLVSIYIPSTVKEIGDEAFAGCTKLKNVKIASEVVVLGKDVFADCGRIRLHVKTETVAADVAEEKSVQAPVVETPVIPQTVQVEALTPVEEVIPSAVVSAYAEPIVEQFVPVAAVVENTVSVAPVSESVQIKAEEPYVDDIIQVIPTNPVVIKPSVLGRENMVFVEGNSEVASFYMDRYEMMQTYFEDLMGFDPSTYKNTDSTLPVQNVSFYDAVYFCNLLSEAEGLTPCYSINKNTDVSEWHYNPGTGEDLLTDLIDEDGVKTKRKFECDFSANGYRLPTEAEWEYAAKGGREPDNYKYSGSDDIDEVAWYKGNVTKPQKVGRLVPNKLGLYDMSGNVCEWCWDSRANYSSIRYYRGGSYDSYLNLCRISSRNGDNAGSRDGIGFRVVRSAAK